MLSLFLFPICSLGFFLLVMNSCTDVLYLPDIQSPLFLLLTSLSFCKNIQLFSTRFRSWVWSYQVSATSNTHTISGSFYYPCSTHLYRDIWVTKQYYQFLYHCFSCKLPATPPLQKHFISVVLSSKLTKFTLSPGLFKPPSAGSLSSITWSHSRKLYSPLTCMRCQGSLISKSLSLTPP